ELLNVESALKERQVDTEIIFVDDGSDDGSIEALLALKQQRDRTKIVKLSRNFGAVHASKTGLTFATGDCATWIAADLQDPPSLIVEMVDYWLKGEKFVICARRRRDDDANVKFFAKL